MKDGDAEKPTLNALSHFVEGVEDELRGADDSLGIVWTAEAAREMDGVPAPPEHMERPLWDDAAGVWRDATTYEAGIVLHAPESDRETRDSMSDESDESTINGQTLDGLERPDN